MLNWRTAVVLLASAILLNGCDFFSGTMSRCQEQWFENDKPYPVRTSPCRGPLGEPRGYYYEVIDGKAYFTVHVTEYRAEAGSGVPRYYYTMHSTNRFLLEDPVDVAALRAWTKDGAITSRYATDGKSLFYQSRRIDGADPTSFQTLHKDFSLQAALYNDEYSSWSRDSRYLYFEATRIENANPDDLRFIADNLFASNGHVFEVYFSEIRERKDMDLSLRSLNQAYSVDKSHVYFKGKVIPDADPVSFRVMEASCPVPGHPGLRCENPESFAKILGEFGRDKNFLYAGSRVVKIRGDETGEESPAQSRDATVFLIQLLSKPEVYAVTPTHVLKLEGSVGSQVKYKGLLTGPEGGYFSDENGKPLMPKPYGNRSIPVFEIADPTKKILKFTVGALFGAGDSPDQMRRYGGEPYTLYADDIQIQKGLADENGSVMWEHKEGTKKYTVELVTGQRAEWAVDKFGQPEAIGLR